MKLLILTINGQKKKRKCNNWHTQWIPFCKKLHASHWDPLASSWAPRYINHIYISWKVFLQSIVLNYYKKKRKKKSLLESAKWQSEIWDNDPQVEMSAPQWTAIKCTAVLEICVNAGCWIWRSWGGSLLCCSPIFFLFSFGLLNHLNLYTFCCSIITQRGPFWKCSGMEY